MVTTEAVQWCEMLWNSMKDGGTWGIPRTGLMFRKDSERRALVLYMRMPHDPLVMEVTAEEVREHQDAELAATRDHFAQLGVEVLDET